MGYAGREFSDIIQLLKIIILAIKKYECRNFGKKQICRAI